MTTPAAQAAAFILSERSRASYGGVRSPPFAPEYIQREVRRRWPGVTLVAAFTEATRMERRIHHLRAVADTR